MARPAVEPRRTTEAEALLELAEDVGIWVGDGACPRLDGNEIWANSGEGVFISGEGPFPIVRANTIRDRLDDGIFVLDGASPDIRGNTITGNALLAIRVDDADPTFGPNVRTTDELSKAESVDGA